MDTHNALRIDVLIAHAEPLLTVGLAAALRQHAEFNVAVRRDATSAEDHSPVDVVVTDYQGGLRHAFNARCHAVPGRRTAARVMVLTGSDREHEIRMALEGGVHGYLLLSCQVDEFVEGVRALGRGSRYLCMSVAQRMAESLTRESLTAREVEVLRLLTHGLCNKSIARDLDIAVGTVKAHVRAIMAKLEARSRTQAASIASQRGLVDGAGIGFGWHASSLPAQGLRSWTRDIQHSA